MKKKWIFGILGVFLLGFGLQAETTLEPVFRQAYNFEQLRIYPQAREEYSKIGRDFLGNYEKTKQFSNEDFSIACAAVCRLALVNGQDQHLNLYQLVNQLDGYNEIQGMLDKMLCLIKEKNLFATPQADHLLVGELLYARAVNRLNLADSLLTGLLWKDYVVYPVANVVNTFEAGLADLRDVCFLDKQAVTCAAAKKKPWFFWRKAGKTEPRSLNSYQTVLAGLAPEDTVLKTLQFVYMTEQIPVLAQAMATKREQQTAKILHYTQSNDVQIVIKQSGQYQTVSDLLEDKKRSLFQVFSNVISMLQ